MTLEEAKAYLRLESDGEDALIGTLVTSAERLCEAFLGTVLIRREFQDMLPASSEWQRLAYAPVQEITAVTGVPAEGAEFALPVDGYAIDIDAAGEGWVRVRQPGAAGRVRVTYAAGIAASAAGVPVPIAQGVTRLAAHLYTERADDAAPPAAVTALWRPYRRVRLGREGRRC